MMQGGSVKLNQNIQKCKNYLGMPKYGNHITVLGMSHIINKGFHMSSENGTFLSIADTKS